ncbi:MAG TPA: DUF932 domain-containing protein, partial [Planctomycetota bacterium]|nr:DUF932 domain-containing protein [Planctomycetota bacterium]
YFESVLPDPKDADPARARTARENFRRLFESGKGNTLPTVRGTLWSALNAVCEYIDHERPTRGGGGETKKEFTRFQSSQFGSGAALRSRAWTQALLLLHGRSQGPLR